MPSPTTTFIHQSTDKAVIDWRDFDIKHGDTKQFQVPSAQSITLNRVRSDYATRIDGNLISNGNVIVMNQHGVIFGQTANVDVNGLLVTTADIDNDAFMRGTNRFDFNIPGNPSSMIANHGRITVQEAGLAGFVAPHLINSGIITARLGKIILATGDTLTLDLYGDKLMEVGISDAVKSQLIMNTRTLDALGGTILMTTSAAQTVVNSLIINTGALSAQSVGSKNGEIVIEALGRNAVQDNVQSMKGLKQGRSRVINNASLDVSGLQQGEKGGKLRVIGDDIQLLDNTILNASGNDGVSGTTNGKAVSSPREGSAGGDIQIGGNYKGEGTTPNNLSWQRLCPRLGKYR
jgi:filamentous hemagglutinin family protein